MSSTNRIVGVSIAVVALFAANARISTAAVKERLYTFDDPGATAGGQLITIPVVNRLGTQDTAPSTTDYGGVDPPLNVNNSFVPLVGSANPARVPIYADASDRPGAAAGNLGLQFDGVNDNLYAVDPQKTTATPYPFDPREFNSSFEVVSQAWVKPATASPASDQYVWRIGTEQGGVFLSTDGKWGFQTANIADEGQEFKIVTDVDVVADQWTHVCVFRGGNNSLFYINGALSAQDAGFWGFEGPDLRVGSNHFEDITGSYFAGIIDSFSIGALSDDSWDPTTDIDYFADAGEVFSEVFGDVVQDGIVDELDYQTWSTNFGYDNGLGIGDPATLLLGDVDGSGTVDLFDFQIIRAEAIAAGTLTAAGWGSPVPEPASGIVALVGVLLLMCRRRVLAVAAASLMIAQLCASSAQAMVVAADDFFYDGPVKILRIGGGFNGYQQYAGGQIGSSGGWTSDWGNSGDGVVMTTTDQYTSPFSFPGGSGLVDDPPEYTGFLSGNSFGPNSLLVRNFTLDSSIAADQTLFFGGQFRADPNIDLVDQYYAPRLYLNRLRGAETTSAGNYRDAADDIAIGYEEDSVVVRLGSVEGAATTNVGFEEMAVSTGSRPDDGQWHTIIGKLEINVDGGDNERLTVWLDPTAAETGGTSVQLERDILTDLTELAGTFDAQAIKFLPAGEEQEEMGRTYIDDVAIGTTWDDVANVSVPRLTLQVNRANDTVSLVNNTTQTFELNGYSIESEDGLLDSGQWSSIANGSADWLENSTTTDVLAETSLFSFMSMGPGSSVSLGGLLSDTSNENLKGRYTTEDGLQNLFHVEFVTIAGLPGDYNENGVVDLVDYTIWRNNLGASISLPNEGGTSPGVVDGDDYLFWKSQFGTSQATSLAGATTVPEPSSGVVLVFAGVALTLVAGRRR